MLALQTRRAVIVAARARTIRNACRAVRAQGQQLGTVAALLARGGPSPWLDLPPTTAGR
jgi:hypothetical protein